MKCTSCNSEWMPPQNEILSKCPYCHIDILQFLNAQIEKLTPEVILRNILQMYGLELLQQEQRLSAMISDLFAHDNRVMKMLLLSVKEKVPQKMLSLKDDHERETRLNAIKTHLKDEAFFNDEIANQMILVWRILPFTWNEPEDHFEIAWYKGFCGLRNSKGKMITSFYYDDARLFQEGMAAVKKDGKWGFIDQRGNEVIHLIYINVTDFSEGLAGVEGFAERTEGFEWEGRYNWGVIDKIGNQITPCKFGKVEMFKEGFAVVGNVYGTSFGYIDYTGNEAIPMKYAEAFSFTDGIALVRSDRYNYNNYSQIDYTGNEIHTVYKPDLKIEDQILFDDGIKTIEVDGKFGLVDREGNEITPIKYNRMGPFCCGLSVIELNNKFGFVDKKGKETFVPYFLHNFYEGIAKVSIGRYTGPYNYINTDGELITQRFFDKAEDFNHGTGYVSFRMRTNYAWNHYNHTEINGNINKFGLWCYNSRHLHSECNSLSFLFCYDFAGSLSDGLIAVSINDKWGYVDVNGEIVIPIIYSMAFDFYDKSAIVQDSVNLKYGVVDLNNNILVPFLYDDISKFQRGLAIVRLNDNYGCVDKTGKIAIPIEFQEISLFPRFENLISGRINEQWGFVDFSGYDISAFEYTKLGYCKDGLLLVNIGGEYIETPYGNGLWGGKYGAIDEHGTEIIPVIYESLGYMSSSVIWNNKPLFCISKEEYYKRFQDEEYWIVSFYQGITRYRMDGKYGLLDINGIKLNELGEGEVENNDWEEFYDDEEWDEKPVYRPILFDNIYKCETGLIKVRRSNKFGYINKDGEVVVTCKYDFVAEFSNGLAIVNVGGDWQDEMDSYSIDPVTGDGESYYKRVFKGGVWGCVNMMGEEQIPVKFTTIEETDSDYYSVSSSEYYGLIDLNGNPIIMKKI